MKNATEMFLLIFLFTIGAATHFNQLLSFVVIHRHGDRNPFTTYKTDLYGDESHWPEGLGQLTKKGMQRQYNLGLWLRARYPFLPTTYSPKTIRVVSTDVDRTLMSAQLTLAGFFPPSESQKFDKNINWQPIPIHTTPSNQDPLLAMKKPCKKYKKMFKDFLNSPYVTKINEENKDLYQFLSNRTGEDIRDVYGVELIHNALHSQFLVNKTLPQWALEVYPEKIKPLVALRYKSPCYTPELARLKTGLLFGEIMKNFRMVIEGEVGGVKVLLFSGHDSTVADVLTTMGVFNNEVPTYSSAIIFELKKKEEGAHYINIVFKNSTGVHDIQLEMCDFDCRYENFRKIFEAVVVKNIEEWEKECES